MRSPLLPHPASRLAAVLLTSAAALPTAQAGLGLDDALARQRRLASVDASGSGLAEAQVSLPDGLLVVAGQEFGRLPALIASPLAAGGSGLRAVHTLRDGSDGGPRLRLGLLGREEAARHWTLEGTELAMPAGPGWLYASVQRRHWGPTWSGSLILDAAAPALPAVGWRKDADTAPESRWLSWLGPWNADLFIGRLSGHSQPQRPYLIGMRLVANPWPSLQLGASRTVQWGGSGRDQGLSSFWNGLTGNDNQGGTANEPGNQLAGFDARWRHALAGGHQLALYGQLIGEDGRNKMPYKFLSTGGAEWALQRQGRSLRLFLEHANTTAGSGFGTLRPGTAYRHHIYQQGYTQEGLPLGHPVGADVRITTLGALMEAGPLGAEVVAYKGQALPTATRLAPRSVQGVNAALSWRLQGGQQLGAGLWHGRDGAGSDSAAQVWWQQRWQ